MYRFSQTFFLKHRNIAADSISFGIKINERRTVKTALIIESLNSEF